MKIASVSEDNKVEKRIAITPEIAKKYISLGFEVTLSEKYGDHLVFKDADFSITRGDKISLIGKNGTGKSTLIKSLVNDLEHEGSIELGHQVMLGYFAQDEAHQLNPNKTVFEIIDDVADDIGDVMKDLSVNISVNVQSEKSDEDIQSLTEDIVDSVNDAVKGLSGEVSIDIQINENG